MKLAKGFLGQKAFQFFVSVVRFIGPPSLQSVAKLADLTGQVQRAAVFVWLIVMAAIEYSP